METAALVSVVVGVAALVVGTAIGWRTLLPPGTASILTVAPLLLVPGATVLLTLAFGFAAR